MTMLAVPAVLMSAPKMNIIVGISGTAPSSDAQYAAYKADNNAEREASAKVNSCASRDDLRILKWMGDLEKDQQFQSAASSAAHCSDEVVVFDRADEPRSIKRTCNAADSEARDLIEIQHRHFEQKLPCSLRQAQMSA